MNYREIATNVIKQLLKYSELPDYGLSVTVLVFSVSVKFNFLIPGGATSKGASAGGRAVRSWFKIGIQFKNELGNFGGSVS